MSLLERRRIVAWRARGGAALADAADMGAGIANDAATGGIGIAARNRTRHRRASQTEAANARDCEQRRRRRVVEASRAAHMRERATAALLQQTCDIMYVVQL
jgi:hypothetical protein